MTARTSRWETRVTAVTSVPSASLVLATMDTTHQNGTDR